MSGGKIKLLNAMCRLPNGARRVTLYIHVFAGKQLRVQNLTRIWNPLRLSGITKAKKGMGLSSLGTVPCYVFWPARCSRVCEMPALIHKELAFNNPPRNDLLPRRTQQSCVALLVIYGQLCIALCKEQKLAHNRPNLVALMTDSF